MSYPAEEGCEYAFYDFGTVSTGTRAVKTIKVSNLRTVAQRYEINRDPDTNPLDHSFYVHPSVFAEVDPERSFVFEIEYAPIVPFTISYDYFNVCDAYGVCCKFGAKGKSLGPLVELSARELVLVCVGPQMEVEKTIVLTNDSVDVARFQFDVDTVHFFQVHPLQGLISANSEVSATIKFTPPRPGVYSRHLFCLIQYQSPLMINVVGIYTNNEAFDETKTPLRKFIHHDTLIGGYESYVGDCKPIVEYQPPIVLSSNCVDFGQSNIEDQNMAQTVSLTNYIKTGVVVQWEEDPTGLFLIEPTKVKIAGDASAIFEVFFRPVELNKFYSRELTARVHWDEKTTYDSLELKNIISDIAVPITITLRLMGNTFVEISAIWPPEYIINSTSVRMPPCVPPLSVYNTFTIERVGINPLMFKFIAPDESHFVVKPMQGVINGDYQIIVVGVCPNTKEEATYLERWILQFNGSPQNEITLDLCAYAEYPKIQINQENVVAFPPTFPGTEQNGQLCLKNFTRHYIWYRFSANDPGSDLWLIDEEGSIASNEITYITWQFVPKEDGFKTSTVTCDTCALLDCWCPFGTFVGSTITVYTESEYTELVSFPSEFDCGIICFSKSKTINFHLFNFGRCKIYFALKCIRYNKLYHFTPDSIEINPNMGRIEPHSKVPISVVISPTHLGAHAFAVSYKILRNGKSTKNVLDKKIRVTTVHYECLMPHIQIADINFIGAGPTVSKYWLWKMLNIDSVNRILYKISPGEHPAVQINIPHAVIDSETLTVFLLFQNITEVKAKWHLKHVVTCKCVVREDYMTRRVFKHKCAHRDQICMYPLSGEIEELSETVVMLRCKYNVLGQNETIFKLQLEFNRSVTISFIVFSLPRDICSPSVYNTSLMFQGEYIGEYYPSIQAYWLYNGAYQPAYYCIDLKTLRKFNAHNMSDVITCINPSGTIPPQTGHPVLFQFTPRALDSYEVNVPICLGTQYYYNLLIHGEGQISFRKHFQQLLSKAPKTSIFDAEEISAFLSTDHLLVGPFLTHSQEEYLIFIENRSSTISIGFSWQKYHLPDFLTCIVKPSHGHLQPREAQICKLTIISHFQPCLLTLQIPCEFINLNLCQKHEEAATIFSQIQEHQDELFTITEKGIMKPECDINLIPLPKPFYRVLAVSCNVMYELHVDHKLSPREQLHLFPSAEATRTHKITSLMTVSEIEILNVLRHVIDTLIWDIMFSERFQNTLENIKNEESVYYGQFVMDDREERELIALGKHVIPRQLLAKIVRNIIFDVFKDEYNLSDSGMKEINIMAQTGFSESDGSKSNEGYKPNRESTLID